MLKPVTEQEKARYTLEIQFHRAVQELLCETYESGYSGYVDIWPVFESNKKNTQVVMTVSSAKVLVSSPTKKRPGAQRYHIVQGKGCKRVK